MLTNSLDTPTDTPNIPRSSTLKPSSNSVKNKASARGNKSAPSPKKLVVTYDLDIEPDNLEPEYVSAKAQLLELSRGKNAANAESEVPMEIAKLEAKIRKIENDVLFDRYSAEQRWKSERIIIEKQLAAAKKEAQAMAQEEKDAAEAETHCKPKEDDVNEEAERIAAEILAQQYDDDDDISGLFASLPQNEVDPDTGRTLTTINSADGTKLVLRDFGKWTGVSPMRVLEEACRSRYIFLSLYLHSGALGLTTFTKGRFGQIQIHSCIGGYVCKSSLSRNRVEESTGAASSFSIFGSSNFD